jgi:hypothetical protein
MNYDPMIAPDPEAWLAADEDARINAIMQYHEESQDELPNIDLHASLHTIVENQLAMDEPPSVRQKLAELMAEGLDRHDGVHAIATVVADMLWEAHHNNQPISDDEYATRLKLLNVQSWRDLAPEE